MIQVYTGSGKGKTTAALGLILRSLGHGKQVLLVRLLKPETCESGEMKILHRLPGIRIINAGVGILNRRPKHEEVRDSLFSAMAKARDCWQNQHVDLMVLDEINNALNHQYLSVGELLALLGDRPPEMEVVMTGRHAPPALLKVADLVTIMDCLRHPMQKGVPAREGIEY